jgi:hypothetical protein
MDVLKTTNLTPFSPRATRHSAVRVARGGPREGEHPGQPEAAAVGHRHGPLPALLLAQGLQHPSGGAAAALEAATAATGGSGGRRAGAAWRCSSPARTPPCTAAAGATARRRRRAGCADRESRAEPEGPGAAAAQSEKDTKMLAQKLGQLQPFLAVFPQVCVGRLASFGPT